jgi:hypothetical protein
MDGSYKLTRAQRWDAECLERKVGSKKQESDPEPEKECYGYVLEANLAFQNGMVIPLLSEVLSASQEDSQKNKQDCEQRAFHRLAQRLKKAFSHLPILLLLDGRHVWLSDQPLHRGNVHSRCNLGARHRWGIEAGFLVEKHQREASDSGHPGAPTPQFSLASA